jgi:hypothetical protein
MLIVFVSTALVAATVYSVEAFDNINEAFAKKTMEAENLAAALAEKEAIANSLKQSAQLTQEREKALTDFIEKQRQQTSQDAKAATAETVQPEKTTAKKTVAKASTSKYWGWMPRKIYIA